MVQVNNCKGEFPIIMGRAWLSTIDAKLGIRDLSLEISKENEFGKVEKKKVSCIA